MLRSTSPGKKEAIFTLLGRITTRIGVLAWTPQRTNWFLTSVTGRYLCIADSKHLVNTFGLPLTLPYGDSNQ